VWFGTNVLTALVIDVYMVAGIRKAEAKKRRAMIARSRKKDDKKKDKKKKMKNGLVQDDPRTAVNNNQSPFPLSPHLVHSSNSNNNNIHLQTTTSSSALGNVNTNNTHSRSGCSRCALKGEQCPRADPAPVVDGRVNLCRNCGHGMMYHTQFQEEESNDYNSKPSSSLATATTATSNVATRKWGAIRQLVNASKQLNSYPRYGDVMNEDMSRPLMYGEAHPQHGESTQNGFDNGPMLPDIYNNNNNGGGGNAGPISPISPGNNPARKNSMMSNGGGGGGGGDNGVLLQTAWLDLQAHSGLRVDDTVSAHVSIDDDLIDPNVLDKLRYNVSATCAKLQQVYSFPIWSNH
jgi:hypothetical protein